MRRLLWIGVVVGCVEARAAEEPVSAGVRPHAGILLETGFGGVFGGDAKPAGRWDARDAGFDLRRVQLTLGVDAGRLFRVASDLSVDEEGVELDEAYAATLTLPLRLGVRAGLFRSRVGLENDDATRSRVFADLPIALGEVFGARGHLAAGAEVGIGLPAGLGITLAAMAANGDGQQSWFGDADVSVEHPRDLVYQLGIEGRWTPGDLTVELGADAVLGPNDTGRRNGTDVWGVAFAVAWRPEDAIGVSFSTEWFIRRQQVPGDVLQDVLGWAQAVLHVTPAWSLAGRYEIDQAVDDNPLDPRDGVHRHRGTLQVGWEPSGWSRLRLAGWVDAGGPNRNVSDDGTAEADVVSGVMLNLEVGAAFTGDEEEEP